MDYTNNISFTRKLLLSVKHIIFKDLTCSLDGNRYRYDILEKFTMLDKLVYELDFNKIVSTEYIESIYYLFTDIDSYLSNIKAGGHISYTTYQLYEDIMEQMKITFKHYKEHNIH